MTRLVAALAGAVAVLAALAIRVVGPLVDRIHARRRRRILPPPQAGEGRGGGERCRR